MNDFTHTHHQEAAQKTGADRNVTFTPDMVAALDNTLANTPETGRTR